MEETTTWDYQFGHHCSPPDATGIPEYAHSFSMCPPALFGWKSHQFAPESQTISTATNTVFLSKCLMLSLSLQRVSGKYLFFIWKEAIHCCPITACCPLRCWHSQAEPAGQFLSLPGAPVIASVSSWDRHTVWQVLISYSQSSLHSSGVLFKTLLLEQVSLEAISSS